MAPTSGERVMAQLMLRYLRRPLLLPILIAINPAVFLLLCMTVRVILTYILKIVRPSPVNSLLSVVATLGSVVRLAVTST